LAKNEIQLVYVRFKMKKKKKIISDNMIVYLALN